MKKENNFISQRVTYVSPDAKEYAVRPHRVLCASGDPEEYNTKDGIWS